MLGKVRNFWKGHKIKTHQRESMRITATVLLLKRASFGLGVIFLDFYHETVFVTCRHIVNFISSLVISYFLYLNFIIST